MEFGRTFRTHEVRLVLKDEGAQDLCLVFFCKPADAGIKLSNIITDRIKVKGKQFLVLFGIKVKMIAKKAEYQDNCRSNRSRG